MLKRIAGGIALGLLVIIVLSTPAAPGSAAPAGKIELRILYAGHHGTVREKEFVEFLGRYFTAVKTSDLVQFNPQDAQDSDVVLLDYDATDLKTPRPTLPDSYARPTITIGIAGGLLSGQRGLKTGYS